MKKDNRKWLNSDKTQMAAVSWYVSKKKEPKTKYTKEHWLLEAEFTLSDCYRTVHLDFNNWDDSVRRRKVLYKKILLLEEEVGKFREALEEAGCCED